jgi:hypothetical protein
MKIFHGSLVEIMVSGALEGEPHSLTRDVTDVIAQSSSVAAPPPWSGFAQQRRQARA